MMVKAGITAQGQRFMGTFFIYFGLAGATLVGADVAFQVGEALIFHHTLSLWFPFPALVLPGLWIPLGFFLIRMAPRRQQIEDRRQVAARGEALVLLAHEQPSPTAAALPLPFTIRLVPSWWKSGAISGGCGLLMLVLLLPDELGSGFLLMNAIFAFVFSGALLTLLALLGHQRIEITAEGLTVQMGSFPARHLGTRETLRWEDAHLFLILPRLLPAQDHLPTAYELSSSSAIVRWVRMRRPMWVTFPALLMKPAGPFDEYDRQMEGVLSVIAEKTRLPLYDLR